MADKRMFSQKITKSDAFISMPTSARLLYYDLSMEADDDGFVDRPKSIMRMTGASEDDIKILIAKSFIIPFENGVCVIKHWRINNYIRSDRHKPTTYVEQMNQLELKDNESYTLKKNQDLSEQKALSTNCQPSGSIDKVRLDKISIDKVSNTNTDNKNKYGEYGRVRLSKSEYARLVEDFGKDKIDNQIIKLDEYVESNDNKNKYKNFNLVIRKSIRENWFVKENGNSKKEKKLPSWYNDYEKQLSDYSKKEEEELSDEEQEKILAEAKEIFK